MDDRDTGARRAFIPLADCEICSQLSEVETSFYKYGWDDQTAALPSTAARLEPAEAVDTYDAERHHVKRCPTCGTYYSYDQSYEYLVNGSEDEEKLTRLTPDQARRFLDDETYAFLMAQMTANLTHADAATRRYAGQCWVSYHLERGEIDGMAHYLKHADADVAKGALFFLWRLLDDWWWQPGNPRIAAIAQLRGVFQELLQYPDQEVPKVVPYLVQRIDRLGM